VGERWKGRALCKIGRERNDIFKGSPLIPLLMQSLASIRATFIVCLTAGLCQKIKNVMLSCREKKKKE
jgi:hypothetical protein